MRGEEVLVCEHRVTTLRNRGAPVEVADGGGVERGDQVARRRGPEADMRLDKISERRPGKAPSADGPAQRRGGLQVSERMIGAPKSELEQAKCLAELRPGRPLGALGGLQRL